MSAIIRLVIVQPLIAVFLRSFFGLFGVYYSLQYLSLSDATVLTFLSPLLTAAVGAIVLKEDFSRREALAGRARVPPSSI